MEIYYCSDKYIEYFIKVLHKEEYIFYIASLNIKFLLTEKSYSIEKLELLCKNKSDDPINIILIEYLQWRDTVYDKMKKSIFNKLLYNHQFIEINDKKFIGLIKITDEIINHIQNDDYNNLSKLINNHPYLDLELIENSINVFPKEMVYSYYRNTILDKILK